MRPIKPKKVRNIEFSYITDPMNKIVCLHDIDMGLDNDNSEPAKLLKKELIQLKKKYILKEDICYKQFKEIFELKEHILETHGV